MVHISSVIEWIAAMWLIWVYAELSQTPAWKGLAIAMLPSLVSAMCACTWHFFDNAPSLDWLVTLQAAMTVIGNMTLCIGGWWVWRDARQKSDLPSEPDI